MLTIELNKEMNQVTIHGSPEKLRWLASKLNLIADQADISGSEHDHFMTKDWGGTELDNELQSDATEIINHLLIYGWRK